jgi:hypothetical protein
VRVTKRNRHPPYRPGDKGTLIGKEYPVPLGSLSYLVGMDIGLPDRIGILFTADEIEPDL